MGTYFEGNAAAKGDDIYNVGTTLTCPSTCEACVKMTSDECYGFVADCTCYSCSCS